MNRRLQSRRITARLRRAGSRIAARNSLAPNFARDFDDECELCEFLVFRQQITERSRRKSALRRQRKLIKIDIFRSGINAPFDVVLVLECSLLAGQKPEHDHFVFRHEAQRLKCAGAFVVVLQKESVDVELVKYRLGYRVVTTGGDPRGTMIAAAGVDAKRHSRRSLRDRTRSPAEYRSCTTDPARARMG